MDDEQDSIDLADDVDTYGCGEEEEDVADDKDRAGVFQSVTRTFGDGSIGLEKSDQAGWRQLSGGGLPQSEDFHNFHNFLIIDNVSLLGVHRPGTTASITTTVMAVERSERVSACRFTVTVLPVSGVRGIVESG
ncbi:hypothetical protein NC651_034746 [Populus alba x Populus x berolinensis]|nr:hypothetical protein NC651_034746 [Populus alba x Populus x berolinensis]